MSSTADFAPPGARGPGVSAEINRAMSSVRARCAEIDRCLRGAPSEAMLESARRRLGEMVIAAEALRPLLPDVYGLRDGTAAQRATRALGILSSGLGGHMGHSAEQVAALLEVSPLEARTWLVRACVKGWAREGTMREGFTSDRPWALTEAGKAFLR